MATLVVNVRPGHENQSDAFLLRIEISRLVTGGLVRRRGVRVLACGETVRK